MMVFQVKYSNILCAAKRMHELLLDVTYYILTLSLAGAAFYLLCWLTFPSPTPPKKVKGLFCLTTLLHLLHEHTLDFYFQNLTKFLNGVVRLGFEEI